MCSLILAEINFQNICTKNFALTFYTGWLLVRAVTRGASDDYGKNQQPFQRAFRPNK
jgi:hypothetical protein